MLESKFLQNMYSGFDKILRIENKIPTEPIYVSLGSLADVSYNLHYD